MTNLTVRLFIVTEMYYWEKKVYKVIADGAVLLTFLDARYNDSIRYVEVLND